MAGTSSIEWCTDTWNPIVGCSLVSPGCTNCYAMRMAARIEKMSDGSHYAGTTQPSKVGAVWTGKVALAPEHILTAPLRWKRPRKIFVNSMGDLFHESIPDGWIDRVFAVMALAPQHTFQVLTKRAKGMRDYLGSRALPDRLASQIDADNAALGFMAGDRYYERCFEDGATRVLLPLSNVWLGVSTEDQARYNERKEHLRATPAAVRFFSMEPLLGPIRADYLGDWVIVGGESGKDARPMHPDWARALRDQCAEAGVSFFFKQWGEWKHGSDFAPNAMAVLHDGRVIEPMHDALEAVSRAGTHEGWSPEMMRRVGKRRAGRLLDGREHNAFPGGQARGGTA